MRVIFAGHVFELAQLDAKESTNPQILSFVRRDAESLNHAGTTNQEVLRVLISRMKYLDDQLPHIYNPLILYHLRAALTLHEFRAIDRKLAKGELEPEYIPTGDDGHWIVQDKGPKDSS